MEGIGSGAAERSAAASAKNFTNAYYFLITTAITIALAATIAALSLLGLCQQRHLHDRVRLQTQSALKTCAGLYNLPTQPSERSGRGIANERALRGAARLTPH